MLSTNITLTNLPELYQIIIKHYLHTAARGPNDLDQRKIDTHHWLEQHRRLYPLLFVSREMYHEVTRIIYCNTSINLENANGRGFRLLRLMATSEHLAVRVVVLELTTKTTPNILEREQVGLVEITDLLLACLRRMSYLTTWNFTHSSGPLPYILQLLTDECPFSLKQMRLTCHQELDPFFWPFIQSQPNITVFGCASYTGKNLNTPADSRLLPIVEKMDVSGFVATTILQTGPRSQLTHLRINKRSPSDPPWSNTNSIRYLFINSTGQSLSETLNLSSFPQLIHVFLPCGDSVEWASHRNINLSPLRSLPNLRSVFVVVVDVRHAQAIKQLALRIMESIEWLEEFYFWASSASTGRYVRIDGTPQYEHSTRSRTPGDILRSYRVKVSD